MAAPHIVHQQRRRQPLTLCVDGDDGNDDNDDGEGAMTDHGNGDLDGIDFIV